jgi:hypothetical protein
MAKITDAEDLLDAVKAVMTNGLNAKILAIETAKIAEGKGLTPTLAAVDATNGYFAQSWSQKILNINPAIFYGVEGVTAQDGGGAVLKTYKIAVYIVLVDDGNTNDVSNRIFRYSRALEELFTNYDFDGCGKIKVDGILPVSIPADLNTSDEMKLGGVLLTIPLA